MKVNALNSIDGYKAGHRQQYPEATELVVSNLTPRSGKYANVPDQKGIIFAGLRYFNESFLIDAWNESFFKIPKEKAVARYKRRMDNYLGKDAVPVDHVEALHDLGYLPIEIKAVPEGTFVPVGIPCMTIHNTLPEFFWLVNYLETVLSDHMWLPCTSATTAASYRKLLDKYADLTGSSKDFVPFQAHDFSMRGMSSLQSAALSGAAHLMSFVGTDTVPAIDLLEDYYEADSDKELVGASVPATEHSVMCMGGEIEEINTFKRLINDVYPSGIVSIVSDTWDFWEVLTEHTAFLKEDIMKRDGKVVFRPDSGNPVDILCGLEYEEVDALSEGVLSRIYDEDVINVVKCRDRFYRINRAGGYKEIPEHEVKGAVEVLWDIFGGTTTDKGFKLLDSHVGLIYGDSITYQIALQIMMRLKEKGFASANVVLGVGSFTYQMVTRDTWGFAVKATYGVVKGNPRAISKNPKTDDGVKKSARGLLHVGEDFNGNLVLTQDVEWKDFISQSNVLQTAFKDGVVVAKPTLSQIRERIINQKGN
jgi:nicotinamide phosphoribosyltransferase